MELLNGLPGTVAFPNGLPGATKLSCGNPLSFASLLAGLWGLLTCVLLMPGEDLLIGIRLSDFLRGVDVGIVLVGGLRWALGSEFFTLLLLLLAFLDGSPIISSRMLPFLLAFPLVESTSLSAGLGICFPFLSLVPSSCWLHSIERALRTLDRLELLGILSVSISDPFSLTRGIGTLCNSIDWDDWRFLPAGDGWLALTLCVSACWPEDCVSDLELSFTVLSSSYISSGIFLSVICSLSEISVFLGEIFSFCGVLVGVTSLSVCLAAPLKAGVSGCDDGANISWNKHE